MRDMPSFKKSLCRFVYKEVQLEARSAAKSLKEGKPAEITREVLSQFDFPSYYNNLVDQVPLLMTVLAAAGTKNKFSGLKVIK